MWHSLLLFGLTLLCISAPATADAQEPPTQPQAVDPTFHFRDTNFTLITALKLFPDGRIAYAGIGGAFASVGTAGETGEVPQFNFGAMDLSRANHIAIDPRERTIYAAGNPRFSGSRSPVTRVGNDEAAWRHRSGLAGLANTVLVLPNYDILVGGQLTGPGHMTNSHGLARLKLTGHLDTTFTNASSAGLEITHATLLANEQILAAYRFTNSAGVVQNGLSRWHPNGLLDTDYHSPLPENGTRRISALARAPGNEIFAALEEPHESGTRTTLVQLDATGAPLTEGNLFSNLVVEGSVHAIAFAATRSESFAANKHDHLLIAGEFTAVGDLPCNNLAALSTNGAVAWAFAPSEGPNAPIHALAVQLDGKVLIGGAFTNVSGAPANRLARLEGFSRMADNYLFWGDAEFRTFEKLERAELLLRRAGNLSSALSVQIEVTHRNGSPLDSSTAWQADIHPFKQIEFAPGQSNAILRLNLIDDRRRENRETYTFRAAVTNDSVAVSRASANLVILDDETAGTLRPDTLWRAETYIPTIGLQADGKIIVAHSSGTRLTRINPDGSIDPTFATNGIPSLPGNFSIWQIEPQPDGRIYVSGRFHTTNNAFGINHLARLNADGTLDRSFNPELSSTTATSLNVVRFEVMANGNVLVWPSRFTSRSQGRGSSLFLFSPTGSFIRSHAQAGQWSEAAPIIAHLPTGEIFVSAPVTASDVWKFNTNGVRDTNFNARFTGTLRAMLPMGNSLLLAGKLDTVNSQPVTNLAMVDLRTGALDTEWLGHANAEVASIHLGGGDLHIGGAFTEVNGVERMRIARLTVNGSLDPTFDPGLGPIQTPWLLQTETNGTLLMLYGGTSVDAIAMPQLVRLEGDSLVLPPLLPPTVELLAPVHGTEFIVTDAVAPLSIWLRVTDPNDDIDTVVVRLNGSAIYTNYATGDFRFEHPMPRTAGSHLLQVTATDEMGLTASISATFTVRLDPFPGYISARKDGEEVVVSYASGSLQASTDLVNWTIVHTGGGDFRPAQSERHQFFRTVR